MSSANRTTSRGGKGAKQEATKTLKNETKVDSPKSVDHNSKVQPTAEQMRIAQIIDTRSDEPGFKDKIRQVMDATRKTEDEVCTALHDCDNDLDKAVNMLLEGKAQGEWETSVKKKKSRQPVSAPAKPDAAANSGEEDWDAEQPVVPVDRERSRTRGGGPPRMRGRGSHNESRGWRGRENKENERNLDEGRGDGARRGGGRMTSGPGRSGRGGRGGGRLGPRTYQSREKQEDSSFPKSIDTWNNPGAEDSAGEPLKMEDWDNEEYTGSLADTKVFTPSGGVAETSVSASEEADTSARSLSTSAASSSGAAQQELPAQPPQMQAQPWFQSSGVGTLNAAQSEYLSQLTQQASDSSKVSASSGVTYKPAAAYAGTSPVAAAAGPVAYSSSVAYSTASYPPATNNSYMQEAAPPRAKQRPRVPPPSKIPSSAVEMPGDAINSGTIGYLDVQFGGLEFGSETSAFEPPPGLDQQPKYAGTGVATSALESTARPPSNMDLPAPPASALDSYSTQQQQQQQKTNNQNSIASQINQVQNLSSSSADSILPPSEHKSRGDTGYRSGGGQSLVLDKQDVGLSYSATSAPSYQAYQKSATSYQPNQYSAASYASNAVTSSSTAFPANTSQMSSFSSTGSGYSSGAPVAPSNTYQSSAYNTSNAYQPTSSYPSITQAPAATPASYQGGSQSVYSGLGYSTASSQQYQNNYSGANSSSQQQNHAKMSSTLTNTTKEAHYDVSAVPTTSLSSASNGSSSTSASAATKTTSSSAGGKSVAGGVAGAGMPPGVQPMMGAATAQHTQYIMGQTGMPYFQQPAPMYSYEDVQLMQQRIPHMPTGYYDMSFQPPTSLATGRDGLTSVAYSMSDGRFARTDNNASPVPATLSQQQTGSHGQSQQIMNAASALPPGYAYYIQSGMVPGSFQYGTPTIYPMAASNAHSTGSSTAYPKPAGYGSGYGSGYDSLTGGGGGGQDYGKSGVYAATGGNSQSQQSKSAGGGGVGGSNSGSAASSASDLTTTMMYGKSHVALGKVNSYEKQGFHSGTPPPFNLAGSQTTPLPPTGGYAPQLFMATAMPPQHHSMHQPPHQMEIRNTARRAETGGSNNQRQSSTQANKTGQAKQGYNPSYWNAN